MGSKALWSLITLLGAMVLGFLVIPGISVAQSRDYQAPHNKPGPASERIFFRAFHQDIASASLRANEMDMYSFSLKTEAARQLKAASDVRVYEAPASSVSLLLNPAPAAEGELNPFSIRDVRFALQYAADRAFISQEIYKGQAQPMIAHVGPSDYDYVTIYSLLKETDITHDADRAKDMVNKAMTQAGATLQNGKWQYKGRPVQVKFIIRVEDERRDVGDLVRTELDNLGFTVIPTYQNFAPAILAVYGSDPQAFQWHIYTEGWSKGAAERYDFSTINQMIAPWLGNMPGWQEVGFWQYTSPEIDTLGKRLFQGNFVSQEERDRLYREMTLLGLKESVRVWLTTAINSFPVSSGLQGITQDVIAGPKSLYTLREAYVPGKDILTIGNVWVWTERTTWNPVGGFGDLYSSDIWRNVYDPPTARDPFTGIPSPFRATYEVNTAGPQGKLDVPQDAFRWDATSRGFVTVGAGIRATSKVTFDYAKYFQSKWHDGQKITMADVIYGIYQSFDMAINPDKSRIEFALATTSRPYLDTFTGFRIVGDSKLEVYLNYWHFTPDYIAEYASLPSLSMPWEILAAMDRLVFVERRAAYSDTAAQRFSVPWLNLVMDRDMRLVRRTLRELRDQGQYPAEVFKIGGTTLVSAKDAMDRYDAALKWLDDRGLAVISNGPFQLVRFDAPAQFAEIAAFRDASYPFKPGDWYRGSPPEVKLESGQLPTIGIGSRSTIDVQVEGPGQLAVQYILQDASTGRVVASGKANAVAPKKYQVQIPEDATSTMTPGLHHLFLLASSDTISSLKELRLDVEATSGRPSTVATPTPITTQPTPKATSTPSTKGRGLSCSGPPL